MKRNGRDGEWKFFYMIFPLAIYNQIVSNALSVSEPFVGNNMWVVGLKDPDGYNIFFESPTGVPEETTYSDWVKTSKEN